MPYYAEMDPENAVDYPNHEQMTERLADEWSDDDTLAVQSIMADYLTGPLDGYAKSKLWRKMIERAELVAARYEAPSGHTGAPE